MRGPLRCWPSVRVDATGASRRTAAPDPEALLRAGHDRTAGRGHHRLYVGMAAGVGKTYRALTELHELRDDGVDAVIGLLETHGRDETARLAEGLEVVPRRTLAYKGVQLTEMDTDAILARAPDVVLVDELAHTNVPGSERPKRYEDVEVLLAHEVDVISTMNVQHLESVNDLVERLTGVRVRELVPDRVLLDADEVILVDVTLEVLRERLRQGKIYGEDRIDRALANFFRPENLSILRELALRQVADAVEGTPGGPGRGVKDKVAVAVTPTPNGARLIRRGAHLAQRLKGDLVAVFVQLRTLRRDQERWLDAHRLVTESLGGTFVRLEAHDAAHALLAFVRQEGVTQLVMGASLRSSWQEFVRRSIINRVIRGAEGVDVYVIGANANGRAKGRST